MLFKTIVPPCERLSAILSGGEGKRTRRQYRNAVWALDFECSNPLEVSLCENAKGKRYSKIKRGAPNLAPLAHKARSAGLSEVLKPQSKVHLGGRFRSLW